MGYSQIPAHEIDSLNGLLHILPEDAFDARGRVYIELGRRTDGEIALRYCDTALSILKDSVQIARAVHNKAAVLRNLARNREARIVLESILPYAQRFEPYQGATELNWYLENIYGMLSVIYAFDGDYGPAIKAAEHALELGALLPGKADLSRTYNHLGIIFYKLRDNERALEMYHKALALQKYPVVDKHLIEIYNANRLTMLTNIAICYSEIDSLSVALRYLDSVSSSIPTINTRIQMNFGYGMVFLKQYRYHEAEAAFGKALKDATERSDVRMIAECLIYSGRVYLRTRQYNNAQQAILKAERLATENNLNEILLDSYRQALALFSATGNYEELANYQEKYIRHKHLIHNAAVASELVLAELRIVEAANKQELAIQQERIDAQYILLKYQRRLSIVTTTVTTLTLMFLLSLVYKIITQRRILKVLSTKINERTDELRKSEKRAKELSDAWSHRNDILALKVDEIWIRLRPDI